MFSWVSINPRTPDGPQTLDLASAPRPPPFAKSCLRPCVWCPLEDKKLSKPPETKVICVVKSINAQFPKMRGIGCQEF